MAPSWIRRMTSCRPCECRHMKPAATLRLFFSDASTALNMPADGRGVDGERLLHEHVDPLLDRVLEVQRPEGGRRGQHRHVAGREAVDGFLVGVETQEAALRAHVDLLAELLRKPAWLPFWRSSNTSAMAWSFTGPPVAAKASPTAPLPRLPQPISANLTVLFSAAWQCGTATPASADAAAAPVQQLEKLAARPRTERHVFLGLAHVKAPGERVM